MPDFDEHTLRVLEYAQITAMLAERTACALGSERARELLPTRSIALVKDRQQETTEARWLMAQHGSLPLGGIHDIRPALVHAQVGQSLSPHELLDLSSTLIGASRLKTFLTRWAEKAPLLSDRAKGIDEFPGLLAEIERCIGRDGQVSDAASGSLSTVRAALRVLTARINERLNAILQSSAARGMLQDAVITIRDDRRCLPVKSEYRREFKGIVHDQSSSGATLFMEPLVVVEINNELKQQQVKERQEIERVLQKLTESVVRLATKIFSTVEIVAGLDLANAKAKLADDMQATEPAFNRNGFIRLKEARHPLLDSEKVVPVSLAFGDKFKVLLVTGPNTGGKTVGLKTVGLLTLMAQAGMHVPADQGTELAHFDQIFADIGDEQSIAQNLSTFSAHITNIVRILKSTGRNALILMDELGAGTDPAEGAAIAKAILGYLLEHNARVIATTHYGELKEYAYSRDGIENAAVEFDPETLRPTYRILQGVPGSSNAFHIARRLGMPNPIVDAAIRNISSADADAGEIMQRLEKSKRIADDERRRAEKLGRELDEMKRRYEERLRDLEVLRREAKERAASEAQTIIKRNQEKMENIIGELRRIGKEGRKTQTARKKMREASDEMIGGIGYDNDPLPVDESDVPAFLKKGDKVRVLSLGGATGEVMADSADSEVMVQVGRMRVTVPLSALRKEKQVVSNMAVFASAKGEPTATGTALEKAANISPEITLIALRADAALPKLDKYLDDAFTANLPTARIIHGKGTGMLRKAIWEFLKGDKRIASFALADADDGGAGATIVRFKE